MMVYLHAFITILSMGTFFGIFWWAVSAGRQRANSESAMLPFALPEEFGQAQQEGAKQP